MAMLKENSTQNYLLVFVSLVYCWFSPKMFCMSAIKFSRYITFKVQEYIFHMMQNSSHHTLSLFHRPLPSPFCIFPFSFWWCEDSPLSQWREGSDSRCPLMFWWKDFILSGTEHTENCHEICHMSWYIRMLAHRLRPHTHTHIERHIHMHTHTYTEHTTH